MPKETLGKFLKETLGKFLDEVKDSHKELNEFPLDQLTFLEESAGKMERMLRVVLSILEVKTCMEALPLLVSSPSTRMSRCFGLDPDF